MNQKILLVCGICSFLLVAAGCSKREGLHIQRLEPDTGPHTGGSSVTIRGSGFQQGGVKGVTVYFGDRKARVLAFQGDDKLLVEPPGGDPGQKVDVIFTFDDARELRLEDAYTYVDITQQRMRVDHLTGEEPQKMPTAADNKKTEDAGAKEEKAEATKEEAEDKPDDKDKPDDENKPDDEDSKE